MLRRLVALGPRATSSCVPSLLWTATGLQASHTFSGTSLNAVAVSAVLTCARRSYAAATPGSSSGSATSSGSGSGASGSGSSGSASASSPSSAAAAAAKKKKLLLRKKKKPTTAAKPASSAKPGTGSSTAASTSHAGHGSSGSGGASGGGSGASGSANVASAAARKRAKALNNKAKKMKLGLKKRKVASGTAASSTAGSGTAANASSASSSNGGSGGGGRAAKSSTRAKKVSASLRRRPSKKVRICVLNSSYAGLNSETAAVDNYWCTPQHYAKKDKQKYTFADVSVEKSDSYRTVRELVTSGKYDLFFNLCDGAKDERRAGVDVVQALEEMNAAFTGADSHSFEPSKIDMKLLVGSSGVRVPNFVLLENPDGLAKKCRHLRFPVIVKHLSGYASVGIHKDNRCDNLDQLKSKVRSFIKKYNHALVEEFIRGTEGTVLACADTHSPHGVKVFRPLMFKFLQGADDFAYFDKKWAFECTEEAYGFLPPTDPSYDAIIQMARNAYKYIMNGVGYGRVDFRIDEKTGKPYFLEINPNCGMWYSEKDGGDFADIMVQGDSTWNHERFVANAISHAMREQAERKPWYFISHDKNGQFSTRASKTVPQGKCLFGDAVHPIPVISKALFKLGAEEPTVGCVVCRGDGIHQAVAIRHSCEPNMAFVHGRTLLFASKRQISSGEELTVDYSTLRDESMPPFACSCGTENCRSMIFPMPASSRTVEGRGMKKILREKKRLWMQERKADKEAENILKKRSHKVSASSSSAASASSSSSSSSTSASSAASGASSK